MKLREDDVRTARLILLVDQLLDDGAGHRLESLIHSLPAGLRELYRQRHEKLWTGSAPERQLVSAIAEGLHAYSQLRQAGRNCVSVFLYSLSSSRLRFSSIEDGIFQIPSLITHFVTSAAPYIARPQEPDPESPYYLCIEYRKNHSAHYADLLFFDGLIQGMLRFLRIQNFTVQITKCPLSEKQSAVLGDLAANAEYESDICIYEIRPGKDRFMPVDGETSSEENTEQYVQRVLKRSADLLQESRELMTAVEYLNIANNELEQKIQANHRQLELARNIQKGFVPSRIPDWKGVQFWIKFYPLTEVSGDFYDYFTMGGNKFGLLMCDVSGHGVPAALLSAIAKITFSNHRLDSPSEIFSKVNIDMIQLVKGEGYLTAFYMILDEENKLTYSIAAVPQPLLYRASTNTIEQLQGNGTLLGMFSDASRHFKDYSVRLEPGDKLFIYSDGLTEAVNPEGEMFGSERLIRAIRETRKMSVQQSSEYVMEEFRQFTLGTEAKDDLTLITLMVSEQQGQFDSLVVKSRQSYHKGNLEEATGYLQKAISIFPRHTHTLFNLGRYLARTGHYPEAIGHLTHYIELKPYNADAYIILGYCHYKSGNLSVAVEDFNRSLSLRQNNPTALYNLTRIYLKLGKLQEAEQTFTQLQLLRPEDERVIKIGKKLSQSA